MKRPLTGSQEFAAHEERYAGSSLQIGRKLSVLFLIMAVFALGACNNPTATPVTSTNPPATNEDPPVTSEPSNPVTPQPTFVAVTDITGVPDTVKVYQALTLTGTVSPSNATNKTITWSLLYKPPYNSAIVLNGRLTGHNTPGTTVTVRATVKNGKAQGSDFTKDFYIKAENAVDYGISLWVNGSVWPNRNDSTLPFDSQKITYEGYVPGGDTLFKTVTVINTGKNPVSVSAKITPLTGNAFELIPVGQATLNSLNPDVIGRNSFIIKIKDGISEEGSKSSMVTLTYGPLMQKYTFILNTTVTFSW